MNKFFRIIAVVCVLTMLAPCIYAYDFVTDRNEPTGVTMEIEAEDFVRGSGFSVSEDKEVSGGKYIVGNGVQNLCVEYDLEFEEGVKNFVIYAVHRGESKKSNLSYIKINHFENYSLYDYELGKWNETRIYYGDLNKGKYTIKLSSVRAGQKIDKLIIKYDKSSGDGETFKSVALNNSKTYLPGNDEYAKLDIKEVEERVYGSYFMEAEDGNISSKTIVVDDETASGGKYWVAPPDASLTHLTDYNMTDEIFARFKFKVSHKGNYSTWVRYCTPVTGQKTTWFGFDDQGYTRHEDTVVGGWKWKMVVTGYLDEGWHTLNMKYRQPGQMIDCIVLSDVSGFSAQGLGSLPGEEVRFDSSSWDKIAEVAGISKIKTNNNRIKCDYEFDITKSGMLVPASNLFNSMAIELEEIDNYYVAKLGRKYLKFYMDSDRVIINGQAKNTGLKAYKADGCIPMVSLDAAKEAFGFDYEYNEAESTLNIFSVYVDNYREAEEGEVVVTPGERYISFKIPCDDPTAQCEVWTRERRTDSGALSLMNYDNMNTIKNGGIDYKYNSSPTWSYWRKAVTPIYKDGAFIGSEWANNTSRHQIKVKLVRDGVEDIFVASPEVRPLNTVYDVRLSAEEYAPDTNGELYLTATFENISYYFDCENADANCEIVYRKVGDADWKKAYTPVYDEASKQFRGSIVRLKEGTEYEVMAMPFNKTAKIKTQSSEVPIAKEIKLSEIYDGSGPLLLQEIHGDENGWIKIVGDEKMDTIVASKIYAQAVMIYDCKYLIFENITVKGGSEHCINVGHSDNVRIVNCDISGWGHEGTLHSIVGGYIYESRFLNNRGGIFFYWVENMVIERCYIHDSDIRTNAWNGDTYKNVHPHGSTGIQMLGRGGVVIRYNDIVGSEKHRWNDAMESTNNGGRDSGSLGGDADVYGNMMIYSEDDSIELDGGQMNVRMYDNRMEQSYCGISTAPCTMGPNYIFNNVITNLGNSYNNATHATVKAGGTPDGVMGIQHFFNNTFDANANGPANTNWGGSSEYHSITRNNIFVARDQGTSISSTRSVFKSSNADHRDSNDYDLLGNENYDVKDGDESNAVHGLPTYVDLEGKNFRLAEGSLGAGSGAYIDNFTEYNSPNMGAYQNDGDKRNMPRRPVDMYSDKTYEWFVDKEEREITIHVGDIGEGHTYSLVKNDDYKWLEIISEAGIKDVPLKPDSTVKFKVKGDLSKADFAYGKGMVLFRLENGFSIPITLYCTQTK